MTTRHGKIARLPLAIREELNRRLQNGELSPALLPWLNQLPEVNSVLAQFFASQPISRQNLSEWKQGGYCDWLKHQERELHIRRITEEGAGLKQHEADDLFENFSRIAVAELFADLNALVELQGDERWKRLRSVTRELAHLQREYNRSRQVELTWEKWNHRFEDENAPDEENPTSLPPEERRGEEDRNASNDPPTPPIERGDISATQPEANPPSAVPVKVDQTASPELLFPWQRREAELDKLRTYIPRQIHHRRCERGCICKTCHPQNSAYPHREALRDHTEAAGKGVQAFWRGNVMIKITAVDCDCPCDCNQPDPAEEFTHPSIPMHENRTAQRKGQGIERQRSAEHRLGPWQPDPAEESTRPIHTHA